MQQPVSQHLGLPYGEASIERELVGQAIRSWVISVILTHPRFEGGPRTADFQGRSAWRADAVLCIRGRGADIQARPDCRRDGETRAEPVAVLVSAVQGVRALAPYHRPRAVGPAGETQAVRDLGDPGVPAILAVLGDRLEQSRFGQLEDCLGHLLGQLEVGREADAGAMGPNSGSWSRTVRRSERQRPPWATTTKSLSTRPHRACPAARAHRPKPPTAFP